MIRRAVTVGAVTGLLLLPAGPAAAQGDSIAARLLAAAERYAEQGDSQAALDQIEELLTRFPTGEWVDDALLQSAELHHRLGHDEQALEAAERLAAEFAGTAAGAGGEVLAAEIGIQRAVYAEDLTGPFQRLQQVPVVYPADAFPDLTWRARALVRLGGLARRSGNDAAAAGAYLRAVEDEPVSQWTSRAAVGFAETLLRIGEWSAAVDLLQDVVRGDETLGGELIPDEIRTRASGTLSLVYRFHVAPRASVPSWTRTEALQLVGTSLDEPKGIAIGPDERLLISDEGLPLVGVFDAAGQRQKSLPLGSGELPFWGADGAPYLASSGSVIRLLTSERITFRAEGDEVEDLRAGYVDSVGHWFLVDTDDDRVTQYDAEARYMGTILRERDREPVDIVGRGTGELFVLDRDQKQVIRRAPGAREWTVTLQGAWDRPVALAMDMLDNMYVLDERTRRIHVYDASGAQLQSLGPDLPGGVRLEEPMDLDVDAAGRIYVADKEQGTVWIIR